MYFGIAALPRSRTAWLSNFLTTDNSFCYHDGSVDNHDIKALLDNLDTPYRGTADIGVAILRDTLPEDMKIVVVERDPEEAYRSLIKFIGPVDPQLYNFLYESLQKLKQERDCLIVPYEELNDSLADIWDYCLPTLPFDSRRAKMLTNMNVQVIEVNGYDY